MISLKMRGFYRVALWALVLGLLTVAPVWAEYVIGPDDVLQISFWQDPTLNTEVKVGLDGKISLDIVGQVDAAGRTTAELQNDIVRLMSRLNKNISQTTVRVAQYNYNHVFVIGQVNHSGKYSFEEIPDLWTIINEAGGASETGDLSRVTIIRGGEDAGKVEVVNVNAALATGKLNNLPKIRRGDTIEIGRTPGSVQAAELGRSVEKKSLLYVIGAVGDPGPVSYEENVDVIEAVALAGGPSDGANLKKVRLLMKDGNYAQSVKLNLEAYAASGRPARYIMQKEDMIVVPYRRESFFDSTIGRVATVMAALSTAYLIVNGTNN